MTTVPSHLEVDNYIYCFALALFIRYACEFCSSRQTTYVALGDTVFHGRKTEIWGAGGDSALMVEVRCEDCGGRSKMEHG